MNRLRIDIRPYAAFQGKPWTKRTTTRDRYQRGALTALAVLAGLVVLLLAGCGSCADVDRATPHGLAEWDKYGCADE